MTTDEAYAVTNKFLHMLLNTINTDAPSVGDVDLTPFVQKIWDLCAEKFDDDPAMSECMLGRVVISGALFFLENHVKPIHGPNAKCSNCGAPVLIGSAKTIEGEGPQMNTFVCTLCHQAIQAQKGATNESTG